MVLGGGGWAAGSIPAPLQEPYLPETGSTVLDFPSSSRLDQTQISKCKAIGDGARSVTKPATQRAFPHPQWNLCFLPSPLPLESPKVTCWCVPAPTQKEVQWGCLHRQCSGKQSFPSLFLSPPFPTTRPAPHPPRGQPWRAQKITVPGWAEIAKPDYDAWW